MGCRGCPQPSHPFSNARAAREERESQAIAPHVARGPCCVSIPRLHFAATATARGTGRSHCERRVTRRPARANIPGVKRGPLLAWLLSVGLVLAATGPARAFCGFFVSTSDARLVAPATQVVLMRSGTRTVLSMRNDYQGPPEDFALVIPVPVVLAKENVRTLPGGLFARIDQLGSPRLVEYWEQNPCPEESDDMKEGGTGTRAKAEVGAMGNPNGGRHAPPPVVVEAQFDVDEYEIVILSATDSSALDAWLRGNGYRVPDGAGDALRPYVAAGSKFFVAKVDPAKVLFVGDRAVLSPLRFHYDSDTFSLPIRLGLLSSGDAQDLVVSILADGTRYETANYDNVFIPTNLDVTEEARARFDEFYAALFDATLATRSHAVVTEYAWSSGSCDPCPGPSLSGDDIALLGGAVMPGPMNNVVLTRLHTRYSKQTLGDDLVFRPAPPVVGGRENPGAAGLSIEARPDTTNNFQGRYVIRHRWKGPVRCAEPGFGQWGGPPPNVHRSNVGTTQDPALAPRGKLALASMLAVDVPQLGFGGVGSTGAGHVPRFELAVLAGAALGFLITLADRLRRADAQ